MIVGEALAEGAALLRKAGVDSPSLDSSLLLAASLGIDRSRLLARRSDPLAPQVEERYRNYLYRRATGDCTAYVLGSKEFRGLDFVVTPDVLVPRPDTETLVEAAAAWIDAQPRDFTGKGSSAPLRLLDVCTGSGCVAVSLKSERPDVDVSASDLSPAALAVARVNAERLLNSRHRDTEYTERAPSSSVPSFSSSVSSVADSSIRFYESDLLASVPGRFDLIVSNPPYVPSGVIPGLAVEVRREPRLALDGGADGLDLIRRLVRESRERLDGGGRLLVESGADQTARIAELMAKAGFIGIETIRDLAGLERVTGGSVPDNSDKAAHGE